MTINSTKSCLPQSEPETAVYLFDDWFEPIQAGLRDRVREFIHAMVEGELDEALARPRYGRRARPSSEDAERAVGVSGHRHGHRSRSLLGTFGPVEIEVPRARLNTPDDKTTEWKSQALRAYQRRTLAADALIASTYLAGTNTRRVRRALAALFDGAVGKDTVSRVWRKVKSDWDTWNARSLAEEPIVRLILDGTAVRVRLDRKATSISLLVGARTARGPCCPQQIPLRCGSGLCSHQARSTCARSTAGRRSPLNPLISRLTSPPDPIPSTYRILSCSTVLRAMRFSPGSRASCMIASESGIRPCRSRSARPRILAGSRPSTSCSRHDRCR